jgi:glycogen phosphorylase
MMDKYFSHLFPELKMTRDQFMDIARNQQSWGETFSMPVLALRLSEYANGVSELHGRVARQMWQRPVATAGGRCADFAYHQRRAPGTWLARRMRLLFDRYLGQDWMENLDDPDMWSLIDNIPTPSCGLCAGT